MTTKQLEELLRDTRIADLSHDGEVWDCLLKVGFCFDQGRHISLERTLKAMKQQLREVEACDCEDCSPDYL